MSSKREQEAARRRAAKAQARYEASVARRRDRRIGGALVALVLLVTGVAVALALTNTSDDDPTAQPTSTDPTSTEQPTSTKQPTSAELPTTTPRQYQAAPPATDALGESWEVVMTTNQGDIAMELDGALAPQAVASFLMLARDGYFDGTACHRLLPDSLLQCGDPTATGQGGPGYGFGPVENFPEDEVYPAGTVAMARVSGDGNSQGSQFFLVFNEVTLPSDTAGGYTVFGTVTQGLELLQSIGAAGIAPDASHSERPATDVIIEKVTIS